MSSVLFNVSGEMEGFKTVDLCLEKKPLTDKWKREPNHYKIRDLMTQAAIANEKRLQRSEANWLIDQKNGYTYGRKMPSASERCHVGNKTAVLGSMDLVTDTGTLRGQNIH